MTSNNLLLKHLPKTLSRMEFFKNSAAIPVATEKDRNAPIEERMMKLIANLDSFYPRKELYPLYLAIDGHMRNGYLIRSKELLHNGMPVLGDWSQTDFERAFKIALAAIDYQTDEHAILFTGAAGSGKSSGMEKIQSLYSRTIDHARLSAGKVPLLQIPILYVRCMGRVTPRAVAMGFFDALRKIVGPEFVAHYHERRSVYALYAGIALLCNLFAIGMVMWDEFQDVLQAKGAEPRTILNLMLASISVSKTPMLICGTYHTYDLFTRDVRAGRRFAAGDFRLHRMRNPKATEWEDLCKVRWSYQLVKHQAELTPDLVELLYLYSQGLPAFLNAVMITSQRVAMENESEILNSENIKEGFRRAGLIHGAVYALKSGDLAALQNFPDIWHPDLMTDIDDLMKRAEAKSQANKGRFR
ncbi:TniB family NTP-binding protein [Solimonas sp. SE-A11]|uniref:TniB family NTP-binding protein n=1 Tax=Solimonas sp. SE-A11 TaxID=3054954 RepID=UPI00259CB9E1|nr:TniB family NTP-binding protein [Solimonas sp. SE-A11]MDM4772858.1 TniB family NTP-binding protein [Solimonas sp. SE-A11]